MVVISPASTTKPVLAKVSAATRAVGSCVRIASKMLSETWSASLSGWPSETDSEVNKYSFMNCALELNMDKNEMTRRLKAEACMAGQKLAHDFTQT